MNARKSAARGPDIHFEKQYALTAESFYQRKIWNITPNTWDDLCNIFIQMEMEMRNRE